MKSLYTRSNKYNLSFLIILLLSIATLKAQNVDRVEYFMDNDPGFGKGTSVPLARSQDVTASFQVSVNSLSRGFHDLVVRSFVTPYTVTENGKSITKGGWSLSSRRMFYKDIVVANVSNIIKGEYFADTDPGFGRGLNIPLTAGQDLSNLGFAYDITSLSTGFHNLYARFKDANGNWSLTSVRSFYKETLQNSSTTLPNITKGEYFFDTDPGFGGGSNISITPGSDLSGVTFTADVTSLTRGFHQLYTRFKDANGKWGIANTRSFYKETFASAQPLADIVQLEYYIDNDPGFGKGKKVSITAGKNVEKTFAVDMADVSIGNHEVYVRAQDANKNWSLVSTGAFKVEASADVYVIVSKIKDSLCAGSPVAIPYTVNSAFGSNNIFTAQLSDAYGSFSSPVNIGTLTANSNDTIRAAIPANIGAGTAYRIRIIASSPDDTSAVNNFPITINRVPEQYFTINGKASVCLGSETYTASAAQPGTKYTWELTGGGTLDTSGSAATIKWTTPGSYIIKLTPSNYCGSGQQRTLPVDVFNGAPAKTPTVTRNGRTLYSSTGTVAEGVAAYQWYKDNNAVTGATGSSYFASADGTYTVSYTNPCGIGAKSAPVVVSTKKTQTVTFDSIPDITYSDTSFVLKAVASSRLKISYSILTGPATINGDTIRIDGAGLVTARATQQGNDTLEAAFADRTFNVTKTAATVTLSNLNQVYDGAAKTPSAATIPANLPVTFTYNGSNTPPVNAGAYEVIGAITGNKYVGFAKDTLRITKASQSINFAPVQDREYGNNTFNITASATSGLPLVLSISSDPAGIASVTDKTVTITGIGKVFLAANQAGNQNYLPAQKVSDTFLVSKGSQSINIDIIADKQFDDTAFSFSASSSAGLPLTYSISTIPATGVASIAGNRITLLGNPGSVTITAAQSGNQFYDAVQQQRTFKVLPGTPDLAVKNVTAGQTAIAPGDVVTVSWNVANIGKAASPKNWSENIYLQSPGGQNKILVKQVVFAKTDSLVKEQNIVRSEPVTIPAQLNIGDQGVFAVELIAGSDVKESAANLVNNTGVQQAPLSLKKVLTLEVSGNQLTEGSSAGISAKVSRTGAITNPLTVNIALANSQKFSYPATVTIPAGQSAQTFTVTASENNTIEGTVTDSIQASSAGFQTAKVIVSVLDNDKASLYITQLPAEAMEGDSITFRVSTNLPLKQPLQVLLTSGSKARFPVPPSVTIPAGASFAEVTVKLEQDNIPELDIDVDVVAGAAGLNSAAATIKVKDDDLPKLELVIQTNIISESAGYFATQATLRRSGKGNPVAFTANLSAGIANTLILPAGISMAAGENEKTFTIGVVDNTQAEGDRQVSVTASLYVNSCGCNAPSTSSGSVSASLKVTDNDGPSLQITAAQLTLPEGLANAGTIRISRNTGTNGALTVNLTSSNTGEATVPATVVIPDGQSYADVAVTTIDDGAADGNQQVYFQAVASGYSAGSVWVLVSDQNKPDLQVPAVTLANSSVQAMSVFNYQFSVKNSGFATAPAGIVVRGYLSLDNVIDNSDTLISEDVISKPIAAGQIIQVLNAVKAPNRPGQYKLLFLVNPDLTLTELLTTNNTSQPVSLTIKPDYTATAVVSLPYFKKGTTIPVTGSAVRSDGTAAANEKVEVYMITNGLRRTISATTNSSGNYTTQFVPLANEAGHYSVGAAYPGTGATTEQDNFDILGVRINGGNIPQFKVIFKDTLKGAIAIQNLSNKSLTDFSLVPVNLPNGASIKFDTVAVLAGNAAVNLGYKVTGSALSPGNNYEVAALQATSKESSVQTTDVFYFCQAPNAYVVADVTKIDIAVSQSKGEQVAEIRLVNKGIGSSGKVSINLPQVNWLTSVTPKTLSSMAATDTAIVLLKFHALPEVPFNFPVTGNIGIVTENGNSFNIPFSFEKKSESVGTLKVNVTNQFTFYSPGAPKVSGAHVQVKNYFTGAVYADGYTDTSGVFTASGIPEGKHRIIVDKEKHLQYQGTITVNPGGLEETTVFLNYQAITFNWNVVPTAIQDQYDITLETKFETNVPIPVVTIDMPDKMPSLSGTNVYAFNVTLTNHGLVTAKDVALNLPAGDPEYEFVTNYVPADLLAQQSIQVPVVMQRRTHPLTGGKASIASISNYLGIASPQSNTLAPALNCRDFTGVIYWYKCSISSGLWNKGGKLFSWSDRICSSDPNDEDAPVVVSVEIPQTDGFPQCAICPDPQKFEGNGSSPGYEKENTSCVKCILDLLGAAKSCAGGPGPGCAKAVAGAITSCGNTAQGGSSGRLIRRAPLTTSLGAAFDKAANDFLVAEDALEIAERRNKEYYGDMVKSDAVSVFDGLVKPYTSVYDSIRPAAQQSILNSMAGYEIQPPVMQSFFIRWNTSIYARSQGVSEPNAQYPRIISWKLVKAYSDSIADINTQAIARGYLSTDDMLNKSYKDLMEIANNQSKTVCASVKVQFSQKLTMTREAFDGTLEIFNGHPSEAMDSLSVNIQITDAGGVPSNDLFEIQTKSLTNLSDVTGTGMIKSQQKGNVKFLFIPEVGAAPQQPKVYNFGGSVRYYDPYAKAMVTMPLNPIPLTVNPSPNLMLHYFMERNILGDDALTSPDIEPSVPAELAVMIENQGYGPAVNMTISSAQPKIVENEKGLAINFSLIGSNFQGEPKKLGVTDINFGTIPALQTRIGQWYFTSSLLGKFVSYDAKVVHANSFGNPDLSLVKGVKLHELTRSIREYGAKGDRINDFLVNDIFDTHDIPDIIYFSQGNRTAKVYTAAAGSFSSAVMPPSFTNKLTVTASNTGWNYIKVADPGNRLYDIVSVTRGDGQVIPLDNAWLTFVTLPVSQAPVYENKFHFVDTFPSMQPVTYTIVWKPRNTDIPKVDSIIGAPKEITSTQVQNLKVVFNKSIDASTFNYEDLTLTFQGGQNIINSSVVITRIDTAAFNVDLSKVTTGNGFYAFTVQAANVSDIYGINGAAGRQVTWTQFVGVPTVQAFQGIPEGNIASSFKTIQVLFNLPIDETTVTPQRFKILKEGVVQPGTITIDSVRADHKLFYLSGLKNILTQNGTYEMVVDMANIKSANQVSGVQSQSVTLTVDNAGPIVLSLEKSKTGALDPLHIPFINIKFNEDVVGFNTASVKLTRNGEVLFLNIDQLSNTNLKTWTAGNFGMLTYPDGNYTFTIDLSGVKDALGNTGSGVQQISWTVNRSAIVEIKNLSVTPDQGYSDKDGITADQSFRVTFSLGSAASQVTVSQIDLSGETVLAIVPDVAAGNVSVPVALVSGGNTGIRVTAEGVSGGIGIANKTLFVDQTPLSAQWMLNDNQLVIRQPDTVQLSLSDKLLSEQGFVSAIQLKRNGTVLSTGGLHFKTVTDKLYEISGLRSAGQLPGSYELTFNLQRFVKYSSGKAANGPVSVQWTVQSTNQAPVARAGGDTTIRKAGTVTLNGSASADPDSDPITYRWVAPAGIVLSDSTSAKPSFTVSAANEGKTYSFLLIVSDGSTFTTDVANVVVNIVPDQDYYRSIMTGNWNSASTWQSSADSINWIAAALSPVSSSKNITIRAGHTITVTESVTTDKTTVEPGGVLAVAAGSTLTVLNNGLTLRSDAIGSGSIGTSAGTISGNVTVERYIPARRAWRLITVPFISALNTRATWQEGGANIPGYGTHITGGAGNGFDPSPSNASSMKWYNKSLNVWEPVSSALTPVTDKAAYMLFVRGDRSIDLAKGSSAAANNTVLRATGALKTGTQTVTVPATGFTLIANPYASSVDFTKLAKTNVPDRFYVWDPKRSGVGAYVLFDGADGYQPLTSGGSYTGANTIIESGQAFFVESGNSAGSIVFAESSKSAIQQNVFRGTASDGKLLVNLNVVNADNSKTLADATLTRYNDGYSAAVTSEDAGKLDNIDENIAVVRDNKLLTIERRPVITRADTIFLKMYNIKVKNYQFEIAPANLNGAVASAYLEDAWLNTKTPVSLASSTMVQFSITADAASANPSRFRIVLKAGGTLPVNITAVKAYQKNEGIQVEWKVAAETNISYYEVEKSENSQDFTKVGKVAATGNHNSSVSYTWFDANPVEGKNFFRVKAVENSGDVKLSPVVVVTLGNVKSSIVIYPNPVRDRMLSLQLNNRRKGQYILQLFNAAGQQLFNKTIVHPGGSGTQTIPLGSTVSKGLYQLHITNGEEKITQQVIVQ